MNQPLMRERLEGEGNVFQALTRRGINNAFIIDYGSGARFEIKLSPHLRCGARKVRGNALKEASPEHGGR